MTTVASTTRDTLLNDFTQTSTKAANAPQDQQDRFLKLLMTQMRNQDPLNPMDNAQVTTQLAQISTVSGIDKLNQTLKSMTDSFALAQSLQASTLIGRGVLSDGNTLALENGSAVGGVTLSEAVDGLTVKVRSGDGVELASVPLGPKSAGTLTFQWDGTRNDGTTVADGTYFFDVQALKSGKAVSAQTIGFARVQSVTLGDGQVTLDTEQLGPLRLDQVKQIFQ